jgi:hypothetical protein
MRANLNGSIFLLFLVMFGSPLQPLAKTPDCAGVDSWATQMAFVHLKNAGITDNNAIDFTKTRTERLASEKTGKDVYRQIHHISFTEKSGNVIEVITSNNASNAECSMSGVDVFVISRHLGG